MAKRSPGDPVTVPRRALVPTIEGSKKPLLVLAFLGMLATWDLNATGIVTLEMRSDFGFDLGFITSLTAFITGIGLALAPATGFLVDRVNRLWIIRVAAIVGGLASLATASSDSLVALVVSRGIGAAAIGYGGAIGAPIFPLVADWYPSGARARIFAILNVASLTGAVLGPIVAGLLASSVGWRASYVVLSVAFLLAAALTGLLREPVRGEMDRRELGASEDEVLRPQPPMTFGESWRAARSIATLRRLWYAQPFIYVGGAGALTIMAALFSDVYRLSPGQRGVLAGVGQTTGLVTLIIVSPLADRVMQRSPARMMTITGLIPVAQAAIFVVLAALNIVPLSIFLAVVLATIGALNGVVLFALMSLVTPARVRGLGLQMGQFLQLPGLIVLPLIVNAVSAWDLQTGILFFAPILVVGSVILATGGAAVTRDIRAARAAALADEEVARARRDNREQMLLVRDVDVTYDGAQVLFGVSCSVAAGEIVVLLGTNGAGKSTLLRAIIGSQEASNGAIFVDGLDVTHAPPHENARRGIVMVPGGHAVFPSLTVRENLTTAAGAANLRDEDARARIEDVLELFPALRERLGQHAGNLSGGEQQMLALGQAFLSRPRLLMIDELSLGLAPAVVDQLVRTVRAIHDQGTTVMLVEQSINVALTIAERAIFMEKGEIRFDGPVAELMRRPDLVRAVFMGGALGTGSARAPARVRTTEREIVVRADDVWVTYGGVEALRGASIDAAAGEIVGIIGPNGAGKTTLFDVLAGHATAARGTVTLSGIDVTTTPPHARALSGLGRSFQDARLFGSLTVRECIALAFERTLRVRNPIAAAMWMPKARADERRIRRKVERLVVLLGLRAYADKFVHELSTGTRRAVDIACIMAAEPAAVLLDEPSSGLAQAEAEALAPLLTTLVRETNCAMLVIEHDLPLVSSIADRLVAMDLGTTVVTGTPHEVLTDARVVSSYLAATDDIIKRSDLHAVTDLTTTSP